MRSKQATKVRLWCCGYPLDHSNRRWSRQCSNSVQLLLGQGRESTTGAAASATYATGITAIAIVEVVFTSFAKVVIVGGNPTFIVVPGRSSSAARVLPACGPCEDVRRH